VSPSLGVQIGNLAMRSITRSLRNPVVVIPPLFFPLFILAVLTAGADAATHIKGFPTDSYITFALGAIFVQGSISAATVAGGALEEDMDSGFLSRLSLTPMRGGALLTGQLAGAAVLGVVEGGIYLGVGLAAGAHVEAGVGGALAIVGLMVLFCLAFGALGMMAALRWGGAEDVFPVALGLLFMSSMAMPRNLIDKEWFEKIATYNPLSYLIEAPRALLVKGWDGEALALGGGIAVGGLALAMIVCSATLKRRLQRV
jgi:ABC-2 type transport system permease protein